MIVRALERGIREKKLARALNVNIQRIKRRAALLNGICPDIIHLLKDKPVSPGTFDALRKMKPERQIETCGLMAWTANFSSSYARALFSSQTMQVRCAKPLLGKSAEDVTPRRISHSSLR
jgi:hypothetical protein